MAGSSPGDNVIDVGAIVVGNHRHRPFAKPGKRMRLERFLSDVLLFMKEKLLVEVTIAEIQIKIPLPMPRLLQSIKQVKG